MTTSRNNLTKFRFCCWCGERLVGLYHAEVFRPEMRVTVHVDCMCELLDAAASEKSDAALESTMPRVEEIVLPEPDRVMLEPEWFTTAAGRAP